MTVRPCLPPEFVVFTAGRGGRGGRAVCGAGNPPFPRFSDRAGGMAAERERGAADAGVTRRYNHG